jgi:hypothetical protein
MNHDFFDADDLLTARHERSAAWEAACRGRITTAELYARLAELRKVWGDALYDRGSRS